MLTLGTEVPMSDGVWTVTDRRFIYLTTGQIEMYTLGRDGWEIRLTRRELEANKQVH